MGVLVFTLGAAAVALPLVIGLLPADWTDRHVGLMRALAPSGIASSLALVLAAVGLTAWSPSVGSVSIGSFPPILSGFGVQIDPLSAAMLVLIGYVGLVTIRFAGRYLEGEAAQGRFLKWMSFTIGSAMLFVISPDLIQFTVGWMMTSFGLHELLTYYPSRDWAIWAARKKFLISRLGDLFLIGAIALTYASFGTTRFDELFTALRGLQDGEIASNPYIPWTGVLFVLGAMTKSAQFPFHSWLPDTMETPTPVSALMHAGIINAGGYLILRLYPLVSLSKAAMGMLAIVGAFTAVLASVIMITQSSIKRYLAYSTVAQMGFMMLQCGLGAFVAALLHILAHAAFKAHAFLGSGSAVAARMSLPRPAECKTDSLWRVPVALLLSLVCAWTVVWYIKNDDSTSPGALLQVTVITIALTQLLATGLDNRRTALPSLGLAIFVSGAYAVAYRLVHGMLGHSMESLVDSPSMIQWSALAAAAIGLLSLFVLQVLITRRPSWSCLSSLYVHALNGFYFDIPARRITAYFYREAAPVP